MESQAAFQGETQNLGCLNRSIFKNGKDTIPSLPVRSVAKEKLNLYLGSRL